MSLDAPWGLTVIDGHESVGMVAQADVARTLPDRPLHRFD